MYPLEKKIIDNVDGIDNWVWPENDKDLFIGTATDWIYYHKQYYFKYIQKTDICIQAGGACGMYPKLLAKYFKTVYTFEPHHENFYFLSKNCPEENIIKLNAALGSKTGFVCLEKLDNTNIGQFEVSKTNTGIIPMMTIDSFEFPTVDFIQLDIEGYDHEAIKGATKTIEKYKPVISVEVPLASQENILHAMYNINYIVLAKSSSDLVFVHASNVENALKFNEERINKRV